MAVKKKEEQKLEVTSIEALKEMAGAKDIEVPSFVKGETVVFRMKRPSLMSMAAKGKIPNALLSEANKLFVSGETTETMDKDTLKEMHGVFVLMAKEALVSPSYEELEENGIELTDEQLMFIYNFSQRGITQLFPFRP